MNESYADLHVHTSYSDGLLAPEEVVERAAALGLKAVSITDHDCIDGVDPAIRAAANKDLEVIPGLEVSAVIDQCEIHVLGYFIDHHHPDLVALLDGMKKNRVERMRRIVELLGRQGFGVDIDGVMSSVDHGTVGRLHLARIMKKEGFVRTLREAFDNYIGNDKPCYVEHMRLDHEKAMEAIRGAGGVPVLAHPGTCGGEKYVEKLVKAGMRGIEVYHSDHKMSDERKYIEMAEKYGLVISGGSDCHGAAIRGEILIGRIRVGKGVVDALREEAEKIRAA